MNNINKNNWKIKDQQKLNIFCIQFHTLTKHIFTMFIHCMHLPTADKNADVNILKVIISEIIVTSLCGSGYACS